MNLAGLLVVIWFGRQFLLAPSIDAGMTPLIVMAVIALLFGIHMVMAIGGAAFEVLELGRKLQPQVPAVVISASESPFEIERAQALGAQGYVFKSTPGQVLLESLRRVMEGQLAFPTNAGTPVELTARQLEVIGMLARGLSNKDIATELDVAENTVKVHLATIYKVPSP